MSINLDTAVGKYVDWKLVTVGSGSINGRTGDALKTVLLALDGLEVKEANLVLEYAGELTQHATITIEREL